MDKYQSGKIYQSDKKYESGIHHLFVRPRSCTAWHVQKHNPALSREKRTIDGGEEAGAEVVVEILVLAHLVHLEPFRLRHLLLHQLGCHALLVRIQTSVLRRREAQPPQSAPQSNESRWVIASYNSNNHGTEQHRHLHYYRFKVLHPSEHGSDGSQMRSTSVPSVLEFLPSTMSALFLKCATAL